MLTPIDQYFDNHEEPVKSCLAFLREHIVKQRVDIVETWKYKMPIYCINNKMVCYLWVHKKHKQPYLGIVEGARVNHPELLQEKRARMKILLIDPAKDIPLKTISAILKDTLALYK